MRKVASVFRMIDKFLRRAEKRKNSNRTAQIFDLLGFTKNNIQKSLVFKIA